MAERANKKKKRAVRQSSNVFAFFDQKQIAEFKEAFTLIDHDSDGFIDKEDLKDMLSSLGQNPTDEYVEKMMDESTGSINFTMFLTMMGEKLSGTDPENEILEAFAVFDENNAGFIETELMKEYLTTMGDRFTDDEVEILFRRGNLDKNGRFDYREFVKLLKHGE
ncbi:hypothetical protein MP228_008049 [Amoeboaphelidium protococcarum]|nr:hypothetical protein MP228_008049 [Amoeboaphelidium protococcarum]